MTPVTTSYRDNPRQIYLLETLGLTHDPFASPVAEQELHHGREEPHFFSYYVDPYSPNSDKTLPQLLREARNGFIFGPPGSGKTTLRYTLEAECRAVHDRTLVVTYELSHRIDQPLAAEEHWAGIATELTIDLFIQIIEQLDTLPTPTEYQQQQLQVQLPLVWSRLRRTVVRMREDDFSTEANGLASLWPRLNRPATRYVAPSSKINELINACLPLSELKLEALSGTELLTAGINAARAWGFKRIFVLVDGVDAYEREVPGMLNLIAPLLDNLAHWQARDLFFYFFLTPEMETSVQTIYDKTLNHLVFQPLYYTVIWDKDRLTNLLHQRLWAAGSRIPGFNALATANLEDQLEDHLIQAADHSPRRLLEVVSRLIDAHAQNEPDQPLFTLDDWRRMQAQWGYGSPSPPNLTPAIHNKSG